MADLSITVDYMADKLEMRLFFRVIHRISLEMIFSEAGGQVLMLKSTQMINNYKSSSLTNDPYFEIVSKFIP